MIKTKVALKAWCIIMDKLITLMTFAQLRPGAVRRQGMVSYGLVLATLGGRRDHGGCVRQADPKNQFKGGGNLSSSYTVRKACHGW